MKVYTYGIGCFAEPLRERLTRRRGLCQTALAETGNLHVSGHWCAQYAAPEMLHRVCEAQGPQKDRSCPDVVSARMTVSALSPLKEQPCHLCEVGFSPSPKRMPPHMPADQMHFASCGMLVRQAASNDSLRAIGRGLHRANRVVVMPSIECLALAGLEDHRCTSQMIFQCDERAFILRLLGCT